MDVPYPDEVMAAATAAIIEALGPQGVIDVKWLRGWQEQPVVWLVTETDAERDAVLESDDGEDTARRLLADSGVPSDLAAHADITVESNQDVAKKWWGSWESRMSHRHDVVRVMSASEAAIVDALGKYGVIHIHWFLAYYGEPVVWMVTTTDEEANVVTDHGLFRNPVLQILADAGVPDDLAAKAGVTVESQETVDRDFSGNWWHAMK